MSNRLLVLFSSNIRPLYEQDVLDLLAEPSGTRYDFRYARKYLNEAADLAWQTPELVGTRALVVFSIQSAAKYHDPAFIPVREGKVVDSTASGDFRFVRFELGDYLSLMMPPSTTKAIAITPSTSAAPQSAESESTIAPSAPQPSTPSKKGLQLPPVPAISASSAGWPKDLETAVKWFTGLLKEGGQCPYAYSAALVDDPFDAHGDHFEKGPDIVAFGAAARYLAQTQSFNRARFFACQGLRSAGRDAGHIAPTEGVFDVLAGSTYELVIMHRQPWSVEDRSSFLVSADDDLVRVIGRAGFDIASNYDIVRLPIHIAEVSQPEETVLSVRPDANVQGPSMSVHLRIMPRNKVGQALLTATFILMTALVASFPLSSKDINTDFLWVKAVLIAVATIVVLLAGLNGRSVDRPLPQQ